MPRQVVIGNAIEIALLALVLAAAAYAAHKARRTHQSALRLKRSMQRITHDVDMLYQQFQAYDSVMRLLRLERPLPPLRGWAASPDFLLHLCEHALSARPSLILEFGSGASTVALAQCLKLNGHGRMISVDHDAAYATRTRTLLEQHGLSAYASVHCAPLVPMGNRPDLTWYDMNGIRSALRGIEMVVVDGPPPLTPLARYPALHAIRSLVSSRCTVFLDDADRPSEREAVARWQREWAGLEINRLPAEKGCVKLVVTAGNAAD